MDIHIYICRERERESTCIDRYLCKYGHQLIDGGLGGGGGGGEGVERRTKTRVLNKNDGRGLSIIFGLKVLCAPK